MAELEEDLASCLESQKQCAESAKLEEVELQKLHRRAGLQPVGADGKTAIASLVEALFCHLPSEFREAQRAQFARREGPLGNLSAAGLQL